MTGGREESGHYTSTTELLAEDDRHWRTVGSLPSGRSGLAAVNIDNRVLLAGTGFDEGAGLQYNCMKVEMTGSI